MLRGLTSFVAGSAAFSSFVTLLEQIDLQRSGLLRVLTYHRIDEPDAHPALYPGLISATPAAFEQQMRYLAANYCVVSMPDVLAAHARGVALPSRAVLLTFDDAYRDFAQHAWPTLKRYRLHATLFVPTAFPDHPEKVFWWDRLHQALSGASRRDDLDTPLGRLPLATRVLRGQAHERLKNYVKTVPHDEAMALVDQICDELDAQPTENYVLSWAELRQLVSEGVTLGPHTQNHPLMTRISAAEMHTEAVGSRRGHEREVGQTLPIFAYPSGGFTDEVVQVLARAGFVLSFTTASGINDLCNGDRLRLRRIGIGQRATLAVVRARLLSLSMYRDRRRPLVGESEVRHTYISRKDVEP
jgi:peptidoglycan/xylan/chitin deacetylase (PgdA/CDA1 family)